MVATKVHKIFASTLGIGYVGKGGGTIAALFTVVCWYLLHMQFGVSVLYDFLITVCITVLGIWSSNKVEPFWGKDDKKVVIDEVAGMCVSLLLVPVTINYCILALLLFRFFDIAKPLGIKKMEKLPGGLGVMADDVLSGIYANLIIQLILIFKLL